MTTALGIDPGYATCGLALLRSEGQRWEATALETLRTPSGQPLAARLHVVWARVHEIMESSHGPPDLLAVEAQARAQAGHRERGTTSDEAVAVREVTGLLRALAWQYNVPLVEVEPATWRACLGLPRTAPKAQVKLAVLARIGPWSGRLSEHAADAAAVALAGARVAPTEKWRTGGRSR